MSEPVELKHLYFTKHPVDCIAYDIQKDIILKFMWCGTIVVTVWFPLAFVVFGVAYGDWSDSFRLMFFGLLSTVPLYIILLSQAWLFAWLRRRQAEEIMHAQAEYLANGED
jgi:hypothetical protein